MSYIEYSEQHSSWTTDLKLLRQDLLTEPPPFLGQHEEIHVTIHEMRPMVGEEHEDRGVDGTL